MVWFYGAIYSRSYGVIFTRLPLLFDYYTCKSLLLGIFSHITYTLRNYLIRLFAIYSHRVLREQTKRDNIHKSQHHMVRCV